MSYGKNYILPVLSFREVIDLKFYLPEPLSQVPTAQQLTSPLSSASFSGGGLG